MRDSELSKLVMDSRAELRRAWRQAAQSDDVAVMHITDRGEVALRDIAQLIESGSDESKLRRLAGSPPWTGNEGGADSPASLLVALESTLRKLVKDDDDAVERLVGAIAAEIDSLARERLRELEERAATDSLTGSLSRAAVLEQLNAESARLVRHGGELSVIYMDIDRLKRTNDEEGHAAGDQLLRHMSEIVMKNTRVSDRFGRLGGDEFLLVLPETDAKAAQTVVKKLADLFTAAGLGVTCGIAGTPEAGPEADALVATADAAMREAKLRRG